LTNKTKIDEDTGEVMDNSIRFVQLYGNNLDAISKLSKSELRMFFAIVEYICSKPIIDLTFYSGDSLAKYAINMGIKKTSIYNVLSGMCRKGVIVRIDRGAYIFNKKIVYKGKII